MRFYLHLFPLLYVATLLPACLAAQQLRGLQATSSYKCHVTISNTFLDSNQHVSQVACIYRKDFLWPIPDFPTDLYTNYLSDITRGTLVVRVTNAYVDQGQLMTTQSTQFKVLASPSFSTPSIIASPGMSVSLPNSAIANQTLFILRVVTNDSKPTYSLNQLKTQIIGSSANDPRPSMRKQFQDCSSGQLNFAYKGGQTIYIPASVKSFVAFSDLVEAALIKLAKVRKVASALG